jgi:hypothetical protein
MRSLFSMALLALSAAQVPVTAGAQDSSATLGGVISAFLADSGARTRGLPWTTGNGSAIIWESAAPVRNPDTWMNNPALTLARIGSARVAIGGKPRDLNVRVHGNQAGIQRVSVSFFYDGNFEEGDMRDAVGAALEQGGVALKPLKCERANEGSGFGNLAYVISSAGKLASALWWNWNCAGDGNCGFDQIILYRRAELAQVECAGS